MNAAPRGVALLDVSGSFSDRRFPGPGTVAQTALLLANAIADRVLDVDAPALTALAAPEPAGAGLAAVLDLALPRSAATADPDAAEVEPVDARPEEPQDQPASYPLLGQGWLQQAAADFVRDYGSTFAAVWTADPLRLTDAAITLLAELSLVTVVPGGVLALPLLARYRDARFNVNRSARSGVNRSARSGINRRSADAEVSLFDV